MATWIHGHVHLDTRPQALHGHMHVNTNRIQFIYFWKFVSIQFIYFWKFFSMLLPIVGSQILCHATIRFRRQISGKMAAPTDPIISCQRTELYNYAKQFFRNKIKIMFPTELTYNIFRQNTVLPTVALTLLPMGGADWPPLF